MRSGLSDHATVHHGHWYSARRDEYVPIPEAELAAKRRLIRQGQAHQKCRTDPADPPRSDDRPPYARTAQHSKIGRPASRRAGRTDMTDQTPAPSTSRPRRQHSRSTRRAATVRLGEEWYAPQTTSTATEAGDGAAKDAEKGTPLFRMELSQDPPAKVPRPEEASDSGPALAPYRPPPVEDDDLDGGMDSHGMAPELVVDLEEELEDLNADLLTTDHQSDSPHPSSP